MQEGEQHKALITELKEYAACWLRPQTSGELAIVEKIEKIFQAILATVRAWQICRPNLSACQKQPPTWRIASWWKMFQSPKLPVKSEFKARARGKGYLKKVLRDGRQNSRYPNFKGLFLHASGGWGSLLDPGASTADTSCSEAENLRPSNSFQGLKPCFTSGQMGHLKGDCPMMKCDIGWEVHPTGWAKAAKNPPTPHHPGPHRQQLVTASLGTGSSVSMIWAYLIPEECPGLHLGMCTTDATIQKFVREFQFLVGILYN